MPRPPAPPDWPAYVAMCAGAMRDFLEGRVGLTGCYARIPERPPFVDPETHEFIENTISEIDGSRLQYEDTLAQLEGGISQPDLIAYMNGRVWSDFEWEWYRTPASR